MFPWYYMHNDNLNLQQHNSMLSIAKLSTVCFFCYPNYFFNGLLNTLLNLYFQVLNHNFLHIGNYYANCDVDSLTSSSTHGTYFLQ